MLLKCPNLQRSWHKVVEISSKSVDCKDASFMTGTGTYQCIVDISVAFGVFKSKYSPSSLSKMVTVVSAAWLLLHVHQIFCCNSAYKLQI